MSTQASDLSDVFSKDGSAGYFIPPATFGLLYVVFGDKAILVPLGYFSVTATHRYIIKSREEAPDQSTELEKIFLKIPHAASYPLGLGFLIGMFYTYQVSRFPFAIEVAAILLLFLNLAYLWGMMYFAAVGAD